MSERQTMTSEEFQSRLAEIVQGKKGVHISIFNEPAFIFVPEESFVREMMLCSQIFAR